MRTIPTDDEVFTALERAPGDVDLDSPSEQLPEQVTERQLSEYALLQLTHDVQVLAAAVRLQNTALEQAAKKLSEGCRSCGAKPPRRA